DCLRGGCSRQREIRWNRSGDGKVAYRQRSRCSSNKNTVVVETGHRVLLGAEGIVATDGQFRSSWRRNKDGIRMRRHVHHQAEMIRLAAGIGNIGLGGVSSAVAGQNDTPGAVESHQV